MNSTLDLVCISPKIHKFHFVGIFLLVRKFIMRGISHLFLSMLFTFSTDVFLTFTADVDTRSRIRVLNLIPE